MFRLQDRTALISYVRNITLTLHYELEQFFDLFLT
jgi:hypothetical protein